jgi:AAA domain
MMNQQTHPFAIPFSVYESHLVTTAARFLDWLWQDRLPASAITLLDGDHGTGKSLLALTIATHISNGNPMPDGTTHMNGGVVIVTPSVNATSTQIPLLSALGANLDRIEILSYVHDPENTSHPSGYRPFSLPEDLPRLFEAASRVNARLIIFDPFINLLSQNNRWTDQRLHHLLADLNQSLIERNLSCLLIRNCPAKGGHARPSVLERSERFLTHAASRLLLAPHPMQPDLLLLAHARGPRFDLAPTLILQIQKHPYAPSISSMTVQDSLPLPARDLLAHRPDSLHHRMLAQDLLKLIKASTDPTHVSTLYTKSPHSSPFQVQRALRDLLNTCQIDRPARGFYSPPSPNPAFGNLSTSTTLDRKKAFLHAIINGIEDETRREAAEAEALQAIAQYDDLATGYASVLRRFMRGELPTKEPEPSSPPEKTSLFPGTLATTPVPEPVHQLNSSAATTLTPEPAHQLNSFAATTPIPEPAHQLNSFAATTPIPEPVHQLNSFAATTLTPEQANQLNSFAATTLTPEPAHQLNSFAETSPIPQPASSPDQTGATTLPSELANFSNTIDTTTPFHTHQKQQPANSSFLSNNSEKGLSERRIWTLPA